LLDRVPELAAVLDCTVSYLLGLTEDPARWTRGTRPPAPLTDRRRLPAECTA
jgi:hypothetical protein